MEQKIENLSLTEIENVYGGPLPVVAYLTATGLGITRIIIAHRQETIAAANRIVVMEAGKLTPPPSATLQ